VADKTTVIGLFTDPQSVNQAVEELLENGFGREQISASAPDPDEVKTAEGDKPALPPWLSVYPEPDLAAGEIRLMVTTEVSRHEAAAGVLGRAGAKDVGAAP
jgi:hypothetical protein